MIVFNVRIVVNGFLIFFIWMDMNLFSVMSIMNVDFDVWFYFFVDFFME